MGFEEYDRLSEAGGLVPVYREMPGWATTDGAEDRASLPKEAQAYLDLIEESVNCPVVIFSAGPAREQTYGQVDWSL